MHCNIIHILNFKPIMHLYLLNVIKHVIYWRNRWHMLNNIHKYIKIIVILILLVHLQCINLKLCTRHYHFFLCSIFTWLLSMSWYYNFNFLTLSLFFLLDEKFLQLFMIFMNNLRFTLVSHFPRYPSIILTNSVTWLSLFWD